MKLENLELPRLEVVCVCVTVVPQPSLFSPDYNHPSGIGV